MAKAEIAVGLGLASSLRENPQMLNSHSPSGLTSDALVHDDHSESIPLRREDALQTRSVSRVDIRTLSAGTEVAVETSNSHYRFVMLDEGGSRALVRGGHHFDREAEARIEGATLGVSRLWLGWIGVGLSLELSVQGKRMDTSRVRSITLSTVRATASGLRRRDPSFANRETPWSEWRSRSRRDAEASVGAVMPTHAVVWIDQHEARIFHVHPGSTEETTVLAPRHHIHRHPKGRGEPREHPDDVGRFFAAVAKELQGTDAILIVGPSLAKIDLAQHLKDHDAGVAANVVGIESADHPTDGQIVALAKRYFRATDRTTGLGT
jgi:hypothetical protein